MNRSTAGGTVRINRGSPLKCNLQITVDEVDVTVLGATMPDPTWSHVDEAGHFHAWTKDGDLPTLAAKAEVEECVFHEREECSPPERNWHECSVCGNVVVPGRVPDPGRKTVPGMPHWQVTVWGMDWDLAMVLQGQRVSITFQRGERVEAFGFAMVGTVSGELGGASEVTFQGAGKLGRR